MKRTTVFADDGDLAILKAAAARLGVTEASLLRDAIHLAAMAHQAWDEPFFTRVYPSLGEGSGQDARDVVEAVWADKAEAYERTKSPAG